MSVPKREVLEVDTPEERERRLQSTLESLNASTPTVAPVPPPPILPFDTGSRAPHPVEPPTELMTRLQAFLPEMEASNAELLQRDPRSIDIEHLEPSDERYIRMNLGLGVLEGRRPRFSSTSSSSTSSLSSDSSTSTSSSSSSSSSDSDSDSDSDESSSSEDDLISTIIRANRPTRPLPRRARPQIEVLSSRSSATSTST